MSLWTFSRPDRLAEARDHARAILDALTARRCDAVRQGDRSAVSALEGRLRAAEGRYRRLCACARAARRRARLSPC